MADWKRYLQKLADEDEAEDKGRPPTEEERAKIQAFIRENADLSDDAFHSFVEDMGLNPHFAEPVAYEMAHNLSKKAAFKLALQDLIPGGKADDKPVSDFSPKQMAMGQKVEMEHTDDPTKAREISRDHLEEFPDYYTRLKKMEDEAKKEASALLKLARNMPHFTEQDRPEKVKEIYRALKRDHPDMPAEMKARIAARQGKKGKQHQGPPYKGPLTKGASRLPQGLLEVADKPGAWKNAVRGGEYAWKKLMMRDFGRHQARTIAREASSLEPALAKSRRAVHEYQAKTHGPFLREGVEKALSTVPKVKKAAPTALVPLEEAAKRGPSFASKIISKLKDVAPYAAIAGAPIAGAAGLGALRAHTYQKARKTEPTAERTLKGAWGGVKGGLTGAALGTGLGGVMMAPLVLPGVLRALALRKAHPGYAASAMRSAMSGALPAAAVTGTAGGLLGATHGGWRAIQGDINKEKQKEYRVRKKEEASGKTVEASSKKASLHSALVALHNEYGPPKVKHAAANYFFYDINRGERDAEALGAPFCKLAARSDVDPWDMAMGVTIKFEQLEKMAQARGAGGDLARFYMSWADEIVKKAGLLDTAIRVGRAAKAGVGAAIPKSSKSLMNAAVKAEQAGAQIPARTGVRQAVKSSLAESRALQQAGGGSIRRGEQLAKADPGLLSAGRQPPITYAPPPAAPTGAASAAGAGMKTAPQGMSRAKKLLLGTAGGLGLGAGIGGASYALSPSEPQFQGG